MKLTRFRIILINILVITAVLFSGTAYAQDEELPDPGITPDSPFYFLDNWGKSVGMFFAFGPEAKARKALEYAEERLAETRVMAAENRMKEMTQAANGYNNFMSLVNQRAEEAGQQGSSDNLSEMVALATLKHLSVLDKVKDRVPEEAWGAISRAREVSVNGQKNALRALARQKPERALDINQAAINARLNRAKIKATENVTAEVEAALEEAAELLEIEEEISEAAQIQGIDNATIAQRIAHATSNRIDVLEGIYDQVPEQARAAIASAMENSVEKYERAIGRLSEGSTPGEIPEEVSVLQRLQEELRERLQLKFSSQVHVSDNTSGNVTAQIRIQVEIQERVQEKVGGQTNLEPGKSEPAESENQTGEEVINRGKARNP